MSSQMNTAGVQSDEHGSSMYRGGLDPLILGPPPHLLYKPTPPPYIMIYPPPPFSIK